MMQYLGGEGGMKINYRGVCIHYDGLYTHHIINDLREAVYNK
jgi:hypothetical protein